MKLEDLKSSSGNARAAENRAIELLESEEKYRILMDSSSEAICIVDPDGNVLECNRASLEMHGFASEPEMIGLNLMELVAERDRRKALDHFEGIKREVSSGSLEFTLLTRDGKEFPALVSAHAVRDQSQDAVSYVAVARQIADRKRTEELFRLAAECASDLIYEWDIESGSLEWFGDIDGVLGYESGEFDRTLDAWLESIHPDDRPRLDGEVKMEREIGGPIDTEYRIRRKDGSWRHWTDRGISVLDSKGKPIRLIGVCTDITEQKRTEEALKESENRFRTLFTGMNEGVGLCEVVSGESGKCVDYLILDVNPAFERILGFKKEDVIGKLASEVLEVAEAPFIEIFSDIAESGGSTAFETYYEPLGMDLYISVFSPRRGTFAIVFKDISERKRSESERRKLEAQFQYAQKLESLGVLAGGIAHDFNNLLMAILGNADLALMELSNVSPARNSVVEIERASRRASELCRQMLAYSGKGRFVVEKIDLSDLVNEMAHMLEVSIFKKIRLRYNFPEDLPPVDADPAQIRQIVMNLIVNASDAIGDREGAIAITTGLLQCDSEYLAESFLRGEVQEGVYVFIEVEDTGCGMDNETVARIFDPFFTTKATGRGLGMAAILGIVRGHNGAIMVDSRPGEGTKIRVLFPAAAGMAASKASKDAESGERVTASGTVMIVDDEEMVRNVGRRMLERGGFSVLTAADGKEAIEIFRERGEEIDCVILDMTMPQMSGEEVFSQLRLIRQDVPVILSSGYSEEKLAQNLLVAGLSGFIQKPYKLKHLMDMLHRVLNDRKAE